MFLSVVIPAYNEEKRLPKTLERVREYLNSQNYEWEVLVINDGSKDATAKVVQELNGKWNKVLEAKKFRLIDNKENHGKGAVVKQGMLEAKGEWRLFMDADGSTDIGELQKLLKFAFDSPAYEVVIGSRYLSKDSIKIKQPLSRRIVSRVGNILVRVLLGIKSVDTQCGFKLFSARAAKEIFPLQTIDHWGFDMEILAIAIKKGYKIKEAPVDWYDAEGSQVKKSAAFKTLKELLAIKWNILKGLYHKKIK